MNGPSCPLSTKAFSFACTALKPSADAGRGETEEQIFGGLDRIGLKRAGHVHEVEGVQMVEMHDMVVQILHPEHEVPDVGGVLGDFHLDRVFEGAGGGQRVGIGAHAAGALREVLYVAGVAPRPKIVSRPRYRVPTLRASLTRPSFTSTSMRRWPSIRVRGSMTTGPVKWLWGVFLASLMGAPSSFHRTGQFVPETGSLQPMHGCPAPTGQLVPIEFDLQGSCS